jgi:ComF family protein
MNAEHWFLPSACLVCEGPGGATEDALICDTCRNRFATLPHPQCERCGQPLTPEIACRLCLDWPAGFAGVRSAVWLDPPARRAVHFLKYEGWWRVGETFAAVMRKGLSWDPGITLVPIPLSAARKRSRGYNQSAVLAEALGKSLGAPVRDVLRRARDTATQTALTPEARRANLAGAFTSPGGAVINPVLVDDVFTTGATLAEAAAALLGAGAESVRGVTFARAMRPLGEVV